MMFNFFSKLFPGGPQPAARRHGMHQARRAPFRLMVGLGLVSLLSGCHTAPPLPPADIQAPGWEIHEGQALWKRQRNGEGIAGEILIAVQKDKRSLVHFSKNPFPIVTAGVGPYSWELEIPIQGKRYSYRGKPPDRLLWFQLFRAIAGEDLPKPWSWISPGADGRWRLENKTSGESLEGYFLK